MTGIRESGKADLETSMRPVTSMADQLRSSCKEYEPIIEVVTSNLSFVLAREKSLAETPPFNSENLVYTITK